jgi:transcriptional regulator with XRE-family HTH domain
MSRDKKSIISINVRKHRVKRGLSQDKLSKLADVSFNTITKIESGATPNPTIDTVRKIADALGVSLDDLMR